MGDLIGTRRRQLRSVAQFAALMSYMVLSGGQHHLTWVLLLLGLLVPFCWRRAW